MVDDRDNDWLSQEMRREGYVGSTSNLDVDHKKDENSIGWNAGALSVKKQHIKEHNKLHTSDSNMGPDPVALAIGIGRLILFLGIIFVLLLLINRNR